MEKVVAVTVTYNSSHFLRRCLDALLNQSYEISKIIIVDNHSEKSHHVSNEKIVQDNKKVEYYYLPDNTGGAGGFEYGMLRALELSPDWVWIMDDDAFPEHDCLEKLLEHKNYANIGCICPAIFGIDNQNYQVYHHKKISPFLLNDSPKYEFYDDFPEVFEIDANAFVGPLISRRVIDDIGVADGGLFIYGDDTEYTYRLTRKYKMIVVKNAIINHRDILLNNENHRFTPQIWWKTYYTYRNRFFFVKKFSKNRLQLFCLMSYLKIRIHLSIIYTKLNKKLKKYKKLKIDLYKKAIDDGVHGRYGKLLDPDQYRQIVDNIDRS